MERVLIKITDEFEIECRNSEYAPTEKEAAAIKEELSKAEWPHSIHAGWPQVEELLASGRVTGKLFVFPDNDRKEVIMCQERREEFYNPKTKQMEKKKAYIPWTMFMAKGETPFWRDMEPDGKLPFWKPKWWWRDPKDGKYKRNKAHVMIHEGAKTAEFCDRLVNDPEMREQRKAHPWAEELAGFECRFR
jgi:hypothetical protein